ncbi:MAG: DUF1846 domain-containing protein [Clostridiales bacterium]|nr:DUF1846 domain-containing protein [Clostridiales bacterium]
MLKHGFDNEEYLEQQTAAIIERVNLFPDKLYLEFGGKLFFDYHASRVLPGFDPNIKIKLLHRLKDRADIILCVRAGDIERKKIRQDFGITYDMSVLKLIDDFREWGLGVKGVIITLFDGQPSAIRFRNRLERRGIKTYTHSFTKGYPTDIETIVSDEGYGANQYIITNNKLVIVTAPGPASGKLATCLSQLYHDHKRGLKSGYAKFETFPIWNLPLDHPLNIAYEAATADLRDSIMIDPFHLKAYGEVATNYNRDVEMFPVIKRILDQITFDATVYQSPTDMGVNKVKVGIIDEDKVKEAAEQEIIRRHFWYSVEYAKGITDLDALNRAELLLKKLGLNPEGRQVVLPARREAEERKTRMPEDIGETLGAAAIQLEDGTIVTGKTSNLMDAASSLILNAIKTVSGIPDSIHLLSPNVINSIQHLKDNILGDKNIALNLEETLIALGISATTNPTAQMALESLKTLAGCEAHFTHIQSPTDEGALRKLGINVTADPRFLSKDLFIL